MKYLKYISLLLIITLYSYSNDEDGTVTDTDTDTDTGTSVDYLITEALLNSSSLVSFETITSTLEDGTSAECYEIKFKSNPVAYGPFCPSTIDEVGGMGFYDGATNPGLRVFSEALLEDIEADGYDIVDDEGKVNVYDFVGDLDDAISYCLDPEVNDDLVVTFIIPVTPVLASENNDIEEIELVGFSLDGVPINGDPPSAINGPAMFMADDIDQIRMPSLDPCGGHQDPAGYYHWHFIPEVVNKVLENNDITEVTCTNIEQTTSVTLSGFAKDGFPIYAYAEEPTDLDDCGGITAITPEYPNGVYHYVASTMTAPNVPQCLKGVAADRSFSYE